MDAFSYSPAYSRLVMVAAENILVVESLIDMLLCTHSWQENRNIFRNTEHLSTRYLCF